MKNILYRGLNHVIQFFQVQLFLSLSSLPILVAWGIPFSIATVIGNFLFSPFLTLFLLVSSLIFFSELFCIPNQWLIIILENITSLWIYVLSFGKKEWLLGFPIKNIWIAFIGSLCGFIVMQHALLGRRLISVIILLSLFLGTTYLLTLLKPYDQEIKISCGKKNAHIISFGKTIILKENGLFSSKKINHSWIQYTLMPEIIKKTGLLIIETVFVDTINGNTFDVLKDLLFHVQVKKVVLPYFLHTLSSKEWRSFYEFKKIAEQENCIIKRYKKEIEC